MTGYPVLCDGSSVCIHARRGNRVMDAQVDASGDHPCYVACMHNPWDKARFRRLLARIMKDAGLSQQQVADAAGISRSQVSRWQSGAHRPNFDALHQLTAMLRQAHPGTADLADALMLAAGYPDASQAAPGEADGASHSITGLTADEAARGRAYIEGLRTAVRRDEAKRSQPPRPARQ